MQPSHLSQWAVEKDSLEQLKLTWHFHVPTQNELPDETDAEKHLHSKWCVLAVSRRDYVIFGAIDVFLKTVVYLLGYMPKALTLVVLPAIKLLKWLFKIITYTMKTFEES